jgi:hypothetical protein
LNALLPAHPKPRQDELLSSWVARIAYANGTDATSIVSESRAPEFSKIDIDMNPSDGTLNRLANITGTPLDVVKQTSLASYEGTLFERRSDPSLPSWILPLGILQMERYGYGMQSCRRCLREEPFFRKEWRLALSVACTKHAERLLDSCCDCGNPITYHKGVSSRAVNRRTTLPLQCEKCKAPYAEGDGGISTDGVLLDTQARLDKVLSDGYATVGDKRIHALLFFKGLRNIIRALITGRKSEEFRCVVAQHSSVDEPVRTWRVGERFEFLRNRERAAVLKLAWPLLDDWPRNFASYAREARLGVCDLTHRYLTLNDIPYWLALEIKGLHRRGSIAL